MTTPPSGKDERKLQIAQDLLALPIGTNKPLQWDMDVLVEYIATSSQQTVQKALYEGTETLCGYCGKTVKAVMTVTPKFYCSPSHRQLAYKKRLAATQPQKDEGDK